MVANISLCLMCTSKVAICCNSRSDYENKYYNGDCLQKLSSSSSCLLCDGSSTVLTKTQDMPNNLLQQIELFMNSTSFPEPYSNSSLCLTCIHTLNIWYEVRSSVMKLRQNDEVDENQDISNFVPNMHLNSKKVETTTNYTTDEKLSVIVLVDSDAEDIEKVKNEEKVSVNDLLASDAEDFGRMVNGALLKKAEGKQREKIKCKSLSTFPNVNQEFKKSDNADLSRAITIDNLLPDGENQLNKSLQNLSSNSSTLSRGNRKGTFLKNMKFRVVMDDSSDSDNLTETNILKLNQKVKLRKLSVHAKVSTEPQSTKYKKYNTRKNQEKVIKIDDCSDEQRFLGELLPKENVNSSSEDNEITQKGNRQKLNICFEFNIQQKHKSKDSQKQARRGVSDTGSIQKIQHKRTRRESEKNIIIDNSSANESHHEEILQRKPKNRKCEKTKKLIDDSSSIKRTAAKTMQKLENSKMNSKVEHFYELKTRKTDVFSEKEDSISGTSTPVLRGKNRFRRSEISFAKLQKTNSVAKKFPKIKLRRRKSTTKSDSEFDNMMNTLRCPICDNVSKTLWETKAHDLFHRKPEKMMVNVVRENLKQLQEECDRNRILSKYLGISANSASELRKSLFNGYASGSCRVNVTKIKK